MALLDDILQNIRRLFNTARFTASCLVNAESSARRADPVDSTPWNAKSCGAATNCDKCHSRNAESINIAGTETPWLYTSGLTGSLKFTVQLSDGQPRRYDVVLHFAETQNARAGERVFSVRIQGEDVIPRLDICAAAGGTNKAFTRKIPNLDANREMTIELIPVEGRAPLICALEIVVQVKRRRAEWTSKVRTRRLFYGR